LARIKQLVIPPAWTDVWICTHANGHLQATGRDERGRKQYRYHPRWSEISSETKFYRLLSFGEALPRIRRQLEKDAARRGLSKDKVVATVIQLLDATGIRVGNEQYVRANNSFGLATLRDQHVEVHGANMRFRFRGKSGKFHELQLKNGRLARVVRACQDLPGQDLFQYIEEDGSLRPIRSDDINAYLQRAAGEPFTAKDFRTWSGTVCMIERLCQHGPCESKKETRQVLIQSIRETAGALGNTATVCKKYYIHPHVTELHSVGMLLDSLKSFTPRRRQRFSETEQMLIYLLRRLRNGQNGRNGRP
jgi:DNA topoisomerase-1